MAQQPLSMQCTDNGFNTTKVGLVPMGLTISQWGRFNGFNTINVKEREKERVRERDNGTLIK